jgi:hypothetical protein
LCPFFALFAICTYPANVTALIHFLFFENVEADLALRRCGEFEVNYGLGVVITCNEVPMRLGECFVVESDAIISFIGGGKIQPK